MKTKYDIKNTMTNTKTTVTNVWRNAVELLIAASMAITAGHAIFTVKTETDPTWQTWILAAAASFIAVYALWLLVRHLNKNN